MSQRSAQRISADAVKRNILAYLAANCPTSSRLASKSTLGYAAFPGYPFKSPQGAAFAVAKPMRELEDAGLVRSATRRHPSYQHGYHLTLAGRIAADDCHPS